jgi:hypothetical protein
MVCHRKCDHYFGQCRLSSVFLNKMFQKKHLFLSSGTRKNSCSAGTIRKSKFWSNDWELLFLTGSNKFSSISWAQHRRNFFSSLNLTMETDCFEKFCVNRNSKTTDNVQNNNHIFEASSLILCRPCYNYLYTSHLRKLRMKVKHKEIPNKVCIITYRIIKASTDNILKQLFATTKKMTLQFLLKLFYKGKKKKR